MDLAEQLIDVGEFARAGELLSIAEADPGVRAWAELNRLELIHRTAPERSVAANARISPACWSSWSAPATNGAWQSPSDGVLDALECVPSRPAAQEVRVAAEHARMAGDSGLRSRALGAYAATLVYGPTPATEMKTELDQIERDASGAYLRAFIEVGRAEAERLQADFEAARSFARRAIESFASLGLTLESSGWQLLVEIELSAGDAEAALAVQLRSDAILAAVGEVGFRSTTQARLAEVHELLGDHAAARAAIDFSDRLTSPDDEINFAITHRVRARLALAEGDADAALRWARSAVEHAFRTDFSVYRAKARLELGHVLAELGHPGQAAPEARAALELFEAKGDRPGAAGAQTFLDRLSVR